MDVYTYFIILFFGIFTIVLLLHLIYKAIFNSIQLITERKNTSKYIECLERENRSMRRTLDYIRFEKLKAEITNLGERSHDRKTT